MSGWRDEKNKAARARLERSLRADFPALVLRHALARPLVPPTPRLAVDSYWRHHPLRADRLARALARRTGAPDGWTWRLGTAGAKDGLPFTFRVPPAPYREKAHAIAAGTCCVCGAPVFRHGWHRPLAPGEAPNRTARWHTACVVAWKLWCDPATFVKPLKARQNRRCREGGGRLLKDAEVDHRVPLYAVWREHRDLSWPDLLLFWGVPNLAVVNRAAHAAKCAREAGERADARVGGTRAGGASFSPP